MPKRETERLSEASTMFSLLPLGERKPMCLCGKIS